VTGGIFGDPNNRTIEVYNEDTTGDNSYEPSATQVIITDTLSYPTAVVAGMSGSKPDNPPASKDDGATYHPCTMASATPSQPTSTTTIPPFSATRAPTVANAVPQQVTVTVTLIPHSTTFPPQTRTISPEDASRIIASIKATDGSAGPEMLSGNPVPVQTSTQAAADARNSPIVVISPSLFLPAQRWNST